MANDPEVEAYIAGIDPAFRPLFDRMRRLAEAAHPEADLTLSYRMPTFKIGTRRLHIGVWQHGISLYGWDRARCADFLERHADLRTSSGTVRLRPEDGDRLSDEELNELVHAALDEATSKRPARPPRG